MHRKQFDKKFKGKERFFQNPYMKYRKAIAAKCVEALS